MNRKMTVAVCSLLAATLFWAGNYVVGAAAVASIPPLSLVLLRWAIALVPLLLIAWALERPEWKTVLKAWPWILVLSAFGMLAYNLFLYGALQFTDAFNASLINAFNPVLISLCAAFFLRQRLTRTAIIGIIAALIGVLIVITKGDVTALIRHGFGAGDLLMLAAIVSWTAYTLIGRKAPKIPPITSTALQAAVAVALLLPVTLATGGVVLPASSTAWMSLLFIAIFPSILSYVLWNKALGVIEPARAGVFLNLITVFTAAITMILGHPFTWTQIVGGIIVLIGVAITNSTAFRKPAAIATSS